jgi:hypothetical protein
VRNGAPLVFGALAFCASMELAYSSTVPGGSKAAIAEALLKAACARPLESGVCLQATNYPTRTDCRLEAAGEPIVGVVAAGGTLALLPYRSNCEPHLHNWGGSLIAVMEGENMRFIGYLVGLSGIDGCLIAQSAQTSFVCRYRYVGLGYELTAVAAYRITKDVSGYAYRMVELAEAGDTTGTFGAPLVHCDRERELIGVEAPLKRTETRAIEADVRVAVGAAISEACARQKAAPLRNVPLGLAIVEHIERAQLYFDPEGAFAAKPLR